MATITRENLGLLNDKLNVKLSKDDYFPSFQKALKDYSKKANIPGFRKGMVPAGMIKKMYGASIFYDEVIKAVEKEIQNYMVNEKPEIFAQPLPMNNDLRNLDMNMPEDYEFPFEIGLKPEISVDNLSATNLASYKVKVTDEMINEEIERLQNRHGKMTEPDSVASEDNVLNVQFQETDADGNPVPDGISKDNSLLVKYFKPVFREQLMGKKKDDKLVVKLNDAFDEKELDWLTGDLGLDKNDPAPADKYFSITITKVGLVEKREMNEEFFNEALPGKEIKTEEDFRNELKNEIQKHWDGQTRLQLHDQIYHLLLDTPMEFPEGFLKRWLQRGGEKEKSEEEVENEYPTFTNQLKWTLLSDKIIKENNLDVSDEELRDSMKKEILQYFGQMKMDGDTSWIESYIDRMMKDEKQVDATYRRAITDKLFSWLETQVKHTSKEIDAEELAAMQHNHSH
ncbi:MAG: trigger factor [Chitinophagaceae bacterium]|nr:trigger factor [Chitinophagaceae bacterium]